MTIESIYGLVYEAKQSANLQTAKQYLDKIADQLGEYVAAQKSRSIGQFDRFRTASRMLKKMTNRPILAKAVMVNGKQQFTNSFIAFRLAGDSIIQNLPMLGPEDACRYPSMESNFTGHTDELFKINVGILKGEIRKTPPSDKYYSHQTNLGWVENFEKEQLLHLLVIMGFKENDEIIFIGNRENKWKPALVEKADGSQAIIIPIRRE